MYFDGDIFRASGFTRHHAHINIQTKRKQSVNCAVIRQHKVVTYVEYRAVSGVFHNIDPPPSLHPASVTSPRTIRLGGTHSILEDARHWIGLLQYNPSAVYSHLLILLVRRQERRRRRPNSSEAAQFKPRRKPEERLPPPNRLTAQSQ